MDPISRSHERVAEKQFEAERINRPVTNLSDLQKRVLRFVYSNEFKGHEGFAYASPEGLALESLYNLGLVQLSLTKNGYGARPTAKGRLLLLENLDLKFPLPEHKRWKITTGLAIAAIVIALGSFIVAMLSLLQSAGRL